MNPLLQFDPDDPYPDSDGQPMADNTEQFDWIVKIKENLEILFADRDDVFIAGDLLWYPERDRLKTPPIAPDVLVAFGRPKGRRGSYKQWEEGGIAPQVVFEILSPSNNAAEMAGKLAFYDRHGVEEYYLYDPTASRLAIWLRRRAADGVARLLPQSHVGGWTSPRLGVRFAVTATTLELFDPAGRPFLTTVELARRAAEAETRAEQEAARAQQAVTRAEQEAARAERLLQRLKAMGIDPDAD
jgi:Uma2 family endonuclease